MNPIPVMACEDVFWSRVDEAALNERLPENSHSMVVRTALKKAADKALKNPPAPVAQLQSAGNTDRQSQALAASRRAFMDADAAAILALAFRALNDRRYLNHVTDILLRWASVHVPTGHPIDETRLDGLVWAYDLVCKDLTADQRKTVASYLERLQQAKSAWQFGPQTEHNNHHTHQLKSEVLLARVMGDDVALKRLTIEAQHHLTFNLDATSGASLDYRERDALYYHAFDMEAWLEIALLNGCCLESVSRGFWFGMNKIQAGDVGDEFTHSTAKIDQQRANAGFGYSKSGSRFDSRRYVRAALVYATLVDPVDPAVWRFVNQQPVERRNQFYQLREVLWMRH